MLQVMERLSIFSDKTGISWCPNNYAAAAKFV